MHNVCMPANNQTQTFIHPQSNHICITASNGEVDSSCSKSARLCPLNLWRLGDSVNLVHVVHTPSVGYYVLHIPWKGCMCQCVSELGYGYEWHLLVHGKVINEHKVMFLQIHLIFVPAEITWFTFSLHMPLTWIPFLCYIAWRCLELESC